MHKHSLTIAGIIAGAAVAGCASPSTVGPGIDAGALESERGFQQRLAVELRFDQEADIDRIASVLLAANEPFCERKGVWLGLGAHSERDFDRRTRPIAQEHFAIDEQLRITWIAEGGPADVAGLKVGDTLLTVGGREIRRRANAWVEQQLAIESVGAETPVELTIEREGSPYSATIMAPRTCGYPVFVNNDPAINAYADGQAIYVNRGLITFSRSEEELALVIAHELAHNAMGHIDAQRRNATVGLAGGLLVDIAFAAAGVNTGGAFTDAGGDIGAMRFSQDFENEADYVGMYFLARAERPLEGVEDFWRRVAAENPRSVVVGSTHPTTPERFLRIQATRDEIHEKAAAGDPLIPNMQEGRAIDAMEAEE